jgi:hypothetical protein
MIPCDSPEQMGFVEVRTFILGVERAEETTWPVTKASRKTHIRMPVRLRLKE